MVDFLSSRADIEQVLSKFYEIHYFDNTPADVPSKRLLKNYYRRMFDRHFLYYDELQYIYYVLKKYKELLNQEGIPESDDLIKLRMKIYDAKSIVRNIFSGRRLDSYGCVNHFRHSEHVKVKELEELIGNAWM
ncbi:MAG: hypothetical protein P8179_20190 [Candidatus Thiodiazotropha sp.]